MIPEREATRKVQQLGSSTLALSLPAEWAEVHGVEKGDSLTIRQNREALSILSPTGSARGSEAVVHADAVDDESLERVVVAQYVLGRRVIEVESGSGTLSSGAIDAVHEAEARLMGLGIIEETAERISIRCSIDPEDFALAQLLERLERTGRTMRQNATRGLAYDNPELAKRARNRERQANRIFLLSLRLVRSAYGNASVQSALGLETGRALLGYRAVAKNLELAADAAADLAELVLEGVADGVEVEESTASDIGAFADRVDDVSELAVDAFVERDVERATEVRAAVDRIDQHQADVLAGLSDRPTGTVLWIRDVLLALHRPARYASRTAEIATNVAFDSDPTFVTIR